MYTQEITTARRTAIVIAVDRSLSMAESVSGIVGQTLTKAEMVASAVNGVLDELVLRARREDGTVRNYYDIAVVGYSGEGVQPLVSDTLEFMSVSELAARGSLLRRETVGRLSGDGQKLCCGQTRTVWIEPAACGATPMYGAFWEIRNMLGRWCSEKCNADSFPPVVINITDGEASDCSPADLKAVCDDIKNLSTSDGNVLIMNIHITNGAHSRPMLFPVRSEVSESDDLYARLLADCSSTLPSPFNAMVAHARGDGACPPFVAMGYNTSASGLVEMLNIGSRSVSGIG